MKLREFIDLRPGTVLTLDSDLNTFFMVLAQEEKAEVMVALSWSKEGGWGSIRRIPWTEARRYSPPRKDQWQVEGEFIVRVGNLEVLLKNAMTNRRKKMHD